MWLRIRRWIKRHVCEHRHNVPCEIEGLVFCVVCSECGLHHTPSPDEGQQAIREAEALAVGIALLALEEEERP